MAHIKPAQSEILGLDARGKWPMLVDPSKKRSPFYWMLLKRWWDHFGLAGDGLIIGETGIRGGNIKKRLREEYPEIQNVATVDLKEADLIWDITTPCAERLEYNWAICQGTLEHVADPVGAMRNVANILKPGGRIFLHTVGPAFKLHRHPLDCYRFLRDALVTIAEKADLKVVDIFWEPYHCFCAYEKAEKRLSVKEDGT